MQNILFKSFKFIAISFCVLVDNDPVNFTATNSIMTFSLAYKKWLLNKDDYTYKYLRRVSLEA